VRAVRGDELEQRRDRRRGVVAPDFADPARQDVAIGRRFAVGDEIDDRRIPGRQPVILVIEMRIRADVGRVVADIAQPRRQAVEAPV